ncbi:MAG: sensor domain-containing diguanylate cyclase [Candidatus Muiribacteriota bacterium]
MQKIKESEFYKKILDNLYDGVYFVNTEREITYWNNGAERITGYSKDEVLNTKCQDNILNHINCEGENLCTFKCPLHFTLKDGNFREAELFLSHKSGSRIPVKVRISPIFNEQNEITGAVEIFSDNSSALAAYEMVEKLRELAFVDEVTGLPNKKYMEMKIENLLSETEFHGIKFGVIGLTLENYEYLVRESGRHKADNILKIIAKTLKAVVAPYHILGTFDKSNFIVIIPNVNQKEFEEFKKRIKIIVNSCNLGIIEFPEEKDEPVNICFEGKIIENKDSITDLFW